MSFPYKRILCPIDFDEYSRDVLKEAAMLTHSQQGILYVLHAVRINPLVAQGATEGPGASELLKSQQEFAQARIDEMLTGIPVHVKTQVLIEFGEPALCIIDEARKLNADLIVMATHGRKGLMHLILGSVAERIVRESPTPVLTIRPTALNASE